MNQSIQPDWRAEIQEYLARAFEVNAERWQGRTWPISTYVRRRPKSKQKFLAASEKSC
jgi:hypothetical protein